MKGVKYMLYIIPPIFYVAFIWSCFAYVSNEYVLIFNNSSVRMFFVMIGFVPGIGILFGMIHTLMEDLGH